MYSAVRDRAFNLPFGPSIVSLVYSSEGGSLSLGYPQFRGEFEAPEKIGWLGVAPPSPPGRLHEKSVFHRINDSWILSCPRINGSWNLFRFSISFLRDGGLSADLLILCFLNGGIDEELARLDRYSELSDARRGHACPFEIEFSEMSQTAEMLESGV